MLYFYVGTDRARLKSELVRAIEKLGKDVEVIRVTDANTLTDLESALRGGGMFSKVSQGDTRAVVLQDTFLNEEMRGFLVDRLKQMKESEELFFVVEEKPDADTRKKIEKFAETSERFDLPASRQVQKKGDIFVLTDALSRANKKALWVGYIRELSKGSVPEAIHGVLFWGAKQMFLRSEGEKHERAAKFVAELAGLPHESRRKGVDLEYALERFILDCA